jgi:hypothetical protein
MSISVLVFQIYVAVKYHQAAIPFQIPHNLALAVIRQNTYKHMYMIFSCLCFDYLYSLYSHKLLNICLVSCFIFPYMTRLPRLGANAI